MSPSRRGLFDILSHNGEEARVLRRIKPGGRAGPSLEERKARDAASRLLLVMSLGSSGEAIPAPIGVGIVVGRLGMDRAVLHRGLGLVRDVVDRVVRLAERVVAAGGGVGAAGDGAAEAAAR